jgi:hypothetical protein
MSKFDPREHVLAYATELLRRPDATLGWSGDTDLFVAYNRLLDSWEIWRENEDATFQCVMRQRKPGQQLDISAVIRSLVARDTHLRNNSHTEQMDRLIAENAVKEQEHQDKAAEALRDTMERVYHAAASKDLKHETGYVRPMTVPGSIKAKISALPD